MSQLTASAGAMGVPPPADARLRDENIRLDPAGAGKAVPLLGVAAIGLAVTAAGAFAVPGGIKHALAAYHAAAMSVLAVCLGCTFFVMAFHLTAAGWSTTIRRQFENVMSFLPFAGLLVLPVLVIEVVAGGHLFTWLNPQVVGQGAGEDYLMGKKDTFLNAPFFLIRAVVYIAFWAFLTRRLWRYSTEQDRTGNRWLTNQAQRTSSWGMLLFALSTAFAAFDWLMTLDYRFFSTMWPVYYFAGAAFSSVPVIVLILFLIQRGSGKLQGVVTQEHFHDLAKFMFGFTVFWAYIAFSQYFLIWYSNIPEETAYFINRMTGGWQTLGILLIFGHFIVPWYLLLWRGIRRSSAGLALLAVWALLMQCADIIWIVRPMVYASVEQTDRVQLGTVWLDAAALVGIWCLFAGYLVRKVHSGPLVPLHDPRLHEGLSHKNYV